MRRREFIALVGGTVAWSSATHAQQLNKVPHVATIWVGTKSIAQPFEEAFLSILRERGYVPGHNLRYEAPAIQHVYQAWWRK